MPVDASSRPAAPAPRKRPVRKATVPAPSVDAETENMDAEMDEGAGGGGARMTQAERRALAERRILDAALELV
ncbi:hypothetical protein, partial [Pseudacidovorax intermedius]